MRTAAAASLNQGDSGRDICRALSDGYDQVVRDLFGQVKETSGDLALVATGGWGRREICPFSDIDFLILTRPEDKDGIQETLEKFLYPLWDAGVRVGHSVITPEEAVELANDDLPTATSLLDTRLIDGKKERFEELRRATLQSVAPGGNANRFVEKLVSEKKKRHSRFGASLYLLEPNLKQGIGGLRDASTAMWVAKARFGIRDVSELVGTGLFSKRQATALSDSLSFLLRTRVGVQIKANRNTDQLTFEMQEALAQDWYGDVPIPEGDIRPAVAPAVEALMREYYLHASAVVQLAEHLLEASTVSARRRPRVAKIDSSFVLFNGKIAADSPDVFQRPAETVRIFRLAREYGVPIYWHTRELLAQAATENPADIEKDQKAKRLFLDALVDEADDGRPSLLTAMHRVGVLNAMIPEFAPCTGRVQHDLYHVYTVDQHQLYAVSMLKKLARGELEEHPIATSELRAVDDLESLYLGTLLHDVGKPLGKGHSEKGAQVALVVARRLGLTEEQAQKTSFLVREHLTMSHLSQRRDLSDNSVIKKFAERVGDEETLRQLYLLTLCDTAMTAPGNLSAWKDQLLYDLFRGTLDFFQGVSGLSVTDPILRAEEARKRALKAISKSSSRRSRTVTWAEGFLERADNKLLTALSTRQMIRQIRLAEKWEDSGKPIVIAVTSFSLKGHTEVALMGGDQPSLLSNITGVFAANGVSVESAVVSTDTMTSEGAKVMDLFRVQDGNGGAIAIDDPRWASIEKELCELYTVSNPSEYVDSLLERRRSMSKLKPKVTPGVETRVTVFDDESDEYTVVEVTTQDRSGVLHAVTRALAESGMSIHLAKISTAGENVSDAFYVFRTRGGGKATDAEAEALSKSLKTALQKLAAVDS